MKRKINPFDYAGDICKALKSGILLTTKRGEEVNTMTIGWGTIGIDWSRPVFIAYVRESRYTKQLLEAIRFGDTSRASELTLRAVDNWQQSFYTHYQDGEMFHQ